MERFDERSKRLARRQESEVFGSYIMPASWGLGLLGFLGVAVLALFGHPEDVPRSTLVPLFGAFAVSPFVMLLVRACRGHFHKDIVNKRTKI